MLKLEQPSHFSSHLKHFYSIIEYPLSHSRHSDSSGPVQNRQFLEQGVHLEKLSSK
jgi:hypothetical protein